MTNRKFTPRPWFANGSLIEGDDGKSICNIVHSEGYRRLEDGPNANLIATSPDLYDALKKCFNAMLDAMDATEENCCPLCSTGDGHEENCDYGKALDIAEMALRKAEAK